MYAHCYHRQAWQQHCQATRRRHIVWDMQQFSVAGTATARCQGSVPRGRMAVLIRLGGVKGDTGVNALQE
eukprot:350056-Chlamydomonas_euryale.AAC.2